MDGRVLLAATTAKQFASLVPFTTSEAAGKQRGREGATAGTVARKTVVHTAASETQTPSANTVVISRKPNFLDRAYAGTFRSVRDQSRVRPDCAALFWVKP